MADEPRVRLDLDARTATLGGQPIHLTRLQFDLLAYLAERPGQVVTNAELMDTVWADSWSSRRDTKTVSMHASWLRRALGDDAASPSFIHTVRGVGYRLEPGAVEVTGRPAPALAAVRELCETALAGVEAGRSPGEVGALATQVLAALDGADG